MQRALCSSGLLIVSYIVYHLAMLIFLVTGPDTA